MNIGNIGNYYGCLSVKEDGNKFYWSIEDWNGDDWDEIPEYLYKALVKYQGNLMKFKHSLKNYGVLLIVPVVHIPIALFLKMAWLITDLGNWVEDNICDKLPKLDFD